MPITRIIAGLDEAGRGAAIGPLVVAGVFIDTQHAGKLRAIGVSDSKRYGSGPAARRKRSLLARQIRAVARAVIVEQATATRVDDWVRRKGLNHLERSMASTILSQGPTVEAATADGLRVFGPLAAEFAFLTAMDRADDTDPVVAAASIVAKDHRDEVFRKFAKRYASEFGPIRGGGYANAATERFLRAYHRKYRALPPEVRLTWQWPIIQELVGIQTTLGFE